VEGTACTNDADGYAGGGVATGRAQPLSHRSRLSGQMKCVPQRAEVNGQSKRNKIKISRNFGSRKVATPTTRPSMDSNW